jgi:hypothetical protein
MNKKIRRLFECFRFLYFVITSGLTVSLLSITCYVTVVVVIVAALCPAAFSFPEVFNFESHLEVQSTLASYQENILSLYPYHKLLEKFLSFILRHAAFLEATFQRLTFHLYKQDRPTNINKTAQLTSQ